MKFKINRDHFSNGLQQVLNIVGARATMPILSNVLIEAGENEISLTTTNLEMGIRCRIQAEVEKGGSITLPVRRLATIVRELPSLEVSLSVSEQNRASIASGRDHFRVMGIESGEFPPLPAFADKHSFVMTQADLLRMLKSVSYAQSTDETRYIMNGVFFNFGDGKLTLVATDGRRLAVISKEMEVGKENEGKLILPAKTVAEMERLLDQGDTVRIAFNERQAAFEINVNGEEENTGMKGSVFLVSKLVEGNYPDYRQVIPKETDRHLKVNRENLLSCVHRAALVASEKNHAVKIKISPNLLEVSSQSPDVGESAVPLNVEYEGPEIQVSFNPQFLMGPLKALTRDEVIFEFKDELSPGVFRTPDSFLCVVMPLRLN